MKRNMGFSLLELLVVMAIVAILTAVVMPMYSSYVQRGKIAEATSILSGQRVRMEQYFQDNRTYQDPTATTCGVTMPTTPEVKYFTFGCVAPTQTTYTITATGIAAQGMGNFSYTINQQNAKSSTITAPGWTGNASCWAVKPEGTC